jgi:hypothetical protein
MPEITNSVGEGGKNDIHDVAIVQVMLRVIKKPLAGNHHYYPHAATADTTGTSRRRSSPSKRTSTHSLSYLGKVAWHTRPSRISCLSRPMTTPSQQ